MKNEILRTDRLLRAFVATLALMLSSSLVHADVILRYDTMGLAGTESSLSPTNLNENIFGGTLTRASGISSNSGTNSFNSTGWNQANFANAIANGDYLVFTIAPAANYSITITSVVSRVQRSGSGATNFAWSFVTDGATNTTSTNTLGGTSASSYTNTSGLVTNVTSALEVRLVGFVGNGGTFRLIGTNGTGSAATSFEGTTTLRSAASLVWDGGRGSGSWTAYNATNANQANWNGNNTPLAGDSLLFAGTTQTNTTNNIEDLLLNTIVFSNTAGTFAISGSAMTVSNGITNLSANAQTFSNAVTLGAAQAFNASAGNLSFAGNVVTAGNTLTVDGSANTAISGVLSGAGGLTKSGNGTLTMSAINTFSGSTAVNGGRLVVDGTNASSAVTVGASGVLGGTGEVGDLSVSGLLAPGNSVGTLAAGNTTFNTAGAFELEMWNWTSAAGTGWDLLAIEGDLTLSLTGPGAFTINLVSMESSTATGFSENFDPALNFTNTFVTFTGNLEGTEIVEGLFAVNTSAFQNVFSGTFSITNIGQTLALVYTALVAGDSYEWSGTSGNWSAGGNWTNGTAPPATGSKLFFSGAGGNSTNNDATVTETDGITFLADAGAYVVEGDALEVGAFGILNESSVTQTVNNALTLVSAQNFDADAGNLVLGGTVNLDTYTLTVTGAEDVTMSGAISGTGGLILAGSGNLTLGGANNYSGGTLVSSGTLIGRTTSLQGGITNNSFVTFDQSTNGTYAGVITGLGRVTKAGGGNVTFSGANGYEGGTLVDGGTLTGSTSSVPGDVEVSSGATFAISQTTTGTFSGAITGNGRFVKDGSGDVTLSGANTYSGGTLVSAGTLTGTASSLQGSITNNAAVVFVQTPDGTYDGSMSGSGSLTKSGAGTLILSGANTYSGGTLVSGGSLVGSTTNLQGTITNNAAVTFDQSGDGTYIGSMSGSGSLTKAGSGQLTLSGASSFSGGTTIDGGELVVDDNDALGFGEVTLKSGSLLATDTTTVANVITVSETVFTFLNETFSNTNGFTMTAGALGWRTSQDYLTLTDGADPLISVTYTGFDGTFLAGQDIDDGGWPGSASPSTIGWTGIDISGGTSLSFSGLFGSAATTTIDSTDFLLVEYQIDGGGYSNAILFQGPEGFNTRFYLNGDTNSATLSSAMQEFSQSLAGTGSTLDLRYSVAVNAGGEDFASDTFRITGQRAGTAVLGSDSENASVTFSGGVTLEGSSDLIAASGGNTTFSGALTGAGGITKTGAGTVTLSAANTFSGGTTISAGVLAVGAGSTTGSISGNVVNNATLQFNRSDNLAFSGAISGIGAVTKLGAGTLTLSGAGSYGGATTVSAGTLELADTDGAAAGSTASVSVANGATLLISQSNQVNNSATVSLSGGTITRGAGVSEVFSSLNITGSGILDFGTGATGNLTFGTYQDNEQTESALLTLNNFLPGNSFTFVSTSFSEGSLNSYFTFGTGFVDYSLSNTGSTFTITAIPEPSTYLAAAGLLSLMLWPSRKRLLKDAKKILGLTPPMRDRLAARREQRTKVEA